MISNRGLILPQLPIGWGGKVKKTPISMGAGKATYTLKNIFTGELLTGTMDDLTVKLNVSKYVIYGAYSRTGLIDKTYEVSKDESRTHKKYLVMDYTTGSKSIMTTRQIVKITGYKETSVRRCINEKKVIAKRFFAEMEV